MDDWMLSLILDRYCHDRSDNYIIIPRYVGPRNYSGVLLASAKTCELTPFKVNKIFYTEGYLWFHVVCNSMWIGGYFIANTRFKLLKYYFHYFKFASHFKVEIEIMNSVKYLYIGFCMNLIFFLTLLCKPDFPKIALLCPLWVLILFKSEKNVLSEDFLMRLLFIELVPPELSSASSVWKKILLVVSVKFTVIFSVNYFHGYSWKNKRDSPHRRWWGDPQHHFLGGLQCSFEILSHHVLCWLIIIFFVALFITFSNSAHHTYSCIGTSGKIAKTPMRGFW